MLRLRCAGSPSHSKITASGVDKPPASRQLRGGALTQTRECVEKPVSRVSVRNLLDLHERLINHERLVHQARQQVYYSFGFDSVARANLPTPLTPLLLGARMGI